jgi:hypothetical protein
LRLLYGEVFGVAFELKERESKIASVFREERWRHQADLAPRDVEPVSGLAKDLPLSEVTQMCIRAFGEEDIDCLQGIVGRRDERSVDLAALLPSPCCEGRRYAMAAAAITETKVVIACITQ